MPTEEDLNFLGRFTYKGQPLFKKGIEKYRVGQQMINDGIAPEDVKAKLEHAAEFEYESKKYSWPETDFRINGAIPKASE